MQGIYLSTNNVHAIMTKKIQYLVCILLNRSTHYSGLTTNAYVVALKYGCLLVAMTKPATYVEPLSSGLSTHMHWVCNTLICPVSHGHTQGYDHLTYVSTTKQFSSQEQSCQAQTRPYRRLEIIYVSASTKILIT